jgi:glycosidase
MRLFNLIVLIIVTCSFALAQLKTPDWAKDAVWYQIFPERFRNGDTSNDPTAQDLEMPADREWHISAWTSDWYKLQPWEQKHSEKFYSNVFDRRYGGDIQGVIDKLDYLSELGVNALYFNPVFEAFSLHKYDASYYHHIDKTFGPDPKNDLAMMEQETDDPSTWHWTAADTLFLKLVREAHKRNMRVIIDGVFNHSGTRCFAFKDVVKNQQQSRYADWYDIRAWDDPSTPENEFKYKGWWDVRSLPEFEEDTNGFIPAVKTYFFNVTRRWMDPNGDGDPSDGVDGWRLDVANEVSHVFWREWRTLVKSINPNGYIVAELWDNAGDWLKGDEFDASMNYLFARASVKYFINTDSMKTTASACMRELDNARAAYPEQANFVLQNLLDSHDTDRLLSMIMNPNRKYDDKNGVRNNPDYIIASPNTNAIRIQKLMALFQMTYLGAPMIYYGDEAGMWGADDPDERKPMVWADLTYENEASHPIPGYKRTSDPVRFDPDLFAYYKQIIAIRKSLPALNRGSFKTLLTDDKSDVLAFERVYGNQRVVVILNNNNQRQSIALDIPGTFMDALKRTSCTSVKNVLKLTLEGKSGFVLVQQ